MAARRGARKCGNKRQSLGTRWPLQRGTGGSCCSRGLSRFRGLSGHPGKSLDLACYLPHCFYEQRNAFHLSLSSSTCKSEPTWCPGVNSDTNVGPMEGDQQYQAAPFHMPWQLGTHAAFAGKVVFGRGKHDFPCSSTWDSGRSLVTETLHFKNLSYNAIMVHYFLHRIVKLKQHFSTWESLTLWANNYLLKTSTHQQLPSDLWLGPELSLLLSACKNRHVKRLRLYNFFFLIQNLLCSFFYVSWRWHYQRFKALRYSSMHCVLSSGQVQGRGNRWVEPLFA